MKSRDDLYPLWLEWVTANLGRDETLARAAAAAATDAVLLGGVFEVATDAARAAWAGEAARRRPLPMPASHQPRLHWAMGIAIGGAALSTALCLIVAVAPGMCGELGCGWLALVFAAYNATWVLLNWFLLSSMRHGSLKAWKTAVVLVAIGAVVDLVGQVAYFLILVDLGAVMLFVQVGEWLGVAGADWFTNLGSAVAGNWLIVHLMVVQLPILVLLMAARDEVARVNQPAAGSARD